MIWKGDLFFTLPFFDVLIENSVKYFHIFRYFFKLIFSQKLKAFYCLTVSAHVCDYAVCLDVQGFCRLYQGVVFRYYFALCRYLIQWVGVPTLGKF